MYCYGMKTKPFGPWCQPIDNLVMAGKSTTEKYYNILYYSKPLKEEDITKYELDILGQAELPKY